ncbi:hypothetical protein, partial [Burkholderia gladioli]
MSSRYRIASISIAAIGIWLAGRLDYHRRSGRAPWFAAADQPHCANPGHLTMRHGHPIPPN